MYDIRSTLDAWLAAGEPVALATVVRTWGSAPRPAGAKLAVSARGIAGSVSAGCVEAAVIEAAGEVLATGRPRRLTFGVTDETAWSVGLACGGEIEVWVERLDPALYHSVAAAMDRDEAVTVATVVHGPEGVLGAKLARVEVGSGGGIGPAGETGPGGEVSPGSAAGPRGDESGYRVVASAGMPPDLGVAAEAATLAAGESGLFSVAPSVELFVDVMAPRPTLAIVGAGHIALALVPLAQVVGYRAVVIDPRAALATAARFPTADRIVVDWPAAALAALPVTPSTAVAVLSHDPKIDDTAVRAALAGPAFYVGALGSQRTQAERRERLRAAGIAAEKLDRLHGPIGLDIGARTPEEIALAILAEITAARRRSRSGRVD